MSFCCWVKLNAINKTHTLFSSRTRVGAGLSFFIMSSNKLRFDNGNDQNSATYQTTFNYIFAANIWYHIAVIQTNAQRKLYINGVLQQTISKASANLGNNTAIKGTIGASGVNNATDSWLNGYLNDVRIYDHALSDKEVEEISKGLILHYKLDGTSCPNKNLLTLNLKTYNSTAYNAYQLNLVEQLELNQPYTIQLWDVDVSHTGKTEEQLGVSVYLGGGSNSLCSWFGPENFINGHADYLIKTFKKTSWNNTTHAENLWLNIYNSPSDKDGDKYMHIGAWKIEKGEVPTSWNGEENICYDSSGYNNNGAIIGSLSTVANSARYDCATFISNGATNYIQSPTLQLPGDQITINYWFKSSNTSPGSNYHMPMNSYDPQAYEMSIHKTGYLRGGLKINGIRNVANCTSTKLSDGNWHMCSMTYDGAIIKRYVDGVMEKSTSVTGTLDTSESFIFGHYGSVTSYHCVDANISDARIYATALTEAQVKELYNTSATIDNLGSVFARELVE